MAQKGDSGCCSSTPAPPPTDNSANQGLRVVQSGAQQPTPVKVIAIGNSNVGKTTLISRFHQKVTTPGTIGVDFFNQDMVVKNEKVQLTVWDTAGQEKFDAVTTSYYRDVDGIMMVYDITDEDTWLNLRNYWYTEAKEKNPDAVYIVVGNKQDFKHKAMVPNHEVSAWCQSKDLLWIGTSALEKTGVKETFQMLVEKILDNKNSAKK